MKLYINHFKSFKGILFALLPAIVFYSCEVQDTEYEFLDSSMPTSLYSSESNGLEVSFSNESAHATTYLWDFGDGDTTALKDPVHQFSAKGEYTITLTSADNNNSTDIYSSLLAVGFPIAAFTYEADRSTITFSNSSDNSTSYIWDFGDGETSAEENPVHTYAAAGNYKVKLTAIDGTDENTVEIDLYVSGKVIPTILSPGFDTPDWETDWNTTAGSTSSKGIGDTRAVRLNAGLGDKLSQTLTVTEDEFYTVSVWIINRKDSQGTTITIKDAADNSIIKQGLFGPTASASSSSSSFEQVSLVFGTGTATSIVLEISDLTPADPDAESRIDDVTIE
jgi:PKD repeat protein